MIIELNTSSLWYLVGFIYFICFIYHQTKIICKINKINRTILDFKENIANFNQCFLERRYSHSCDDEINAKLRSGKFIINDGDRVIPFLLNLAFCLPVTVGYYAISLIMFALYPFYVLFTFPVIGRIKTTDYPFLLDFKVDFWSKNLAYMLTDSSGTFSCASNAIFFSIVEKHISEHKNA